MVKNRFSEISIKIIKLTFKGRFILAKACSDLPLLDKIVKRLFFEGDNIQVLPRDDSIKIGYSNLKIEVNKDISLLKDIVLPSEILKKMIKESKYHFIMNSCICRVSSNCKDYPQDLGCLFLGKGTKRISDKLGKAVSIEEAINHVDKCQEAGLVNIIGRNKIDSIWLNTGPKEELLTICACCQCCCLWKMANQLPKDIGKSIYKMPGVEIIFNIDLCNGCGKCIDKCFIGAISTENNNAKINKDLCRGCGRCSETCKNGAITVNIKNEAIGEAIQQIEPLVNLKLE
ncbi:MAG: DUF362 domain-containing protein [Methanobacteriaceae archaeon]